MATGTSDQGTLDRLEERIQATVALVARLHAEKEAALKDAAAAMSMAEDAQVLNQKLTAELEALRDEKQHVRSRLEKLLGHIDQLSPKA
jgi:FtsZ-binding cell division protein ZapB